MQFKTIKELRSLDEKDLNKELALVTDYLNSISFEHSQGNLKDTSQLQKFRIYIAWMNTILNERQETSVASKTEK